MEEREKRPGRIEEERRMEKERGGADGGIIIKRDISYVGGRIVSATRHARRFCVRDARSCAAPLIKGTRVRALTRSRTRALARARARAFNKRKAPMRECAGALSALCKSVGPICARGPSPLRGENGEEGELEAEGEKEQHELAASKAVPPPPPPR